MCVRVCARNSTHAQKNISSLLSRKKEKDNKKNNDNLNKFFLTCIRYKMKNKKRTSNSFFFLYSSSIKPT